MDHKITSTIIRIILDHVICCYCRAHLDKLLEYVDISVKEGARLVYGGKRVDRPGGRMRLRVDYILYHVMQDSLWSPPLLLMWRIT